MVKSICLQGSIHFPTLIAYTQCGSAGLIYYLGYKYFIEISGSMLLSCIYCLFFSDVVVSLSDMKGKNLYQIYETDTYDSVLQYPYKTTGNSRVKRDCKHYAYGHKAGEWSVAHGRDKEGISDELTLPIVESLHSTYTVAENSYNARDILLHVAYVHNPMKTVSVYEPLHDGTCKMRNRTLAKVKTTAEIRHCIVASNAGLFNTKNGACYGRCSYFKEK